MVSYSAERLMRYAIDSIPCQQRAYVAKGGEYDNCYCSHCGDFVGHGGQRYCPSCGREFVSKTYTQTMCYFTILTTKDGHKAEHFYQVKAKFKRYAPIEITSIREVFCIEQNERGKLTCRGLRKGMGNSYNLDIFSGDDKWVNRTLASRQIDAISTADIDRHCLRSRSFTWGEQHYGLHRAKTMMKYSFMETLMKQHSPICGWAYDDWDCQKIGKYWPQIKIARRQGYEIGDFKMWADMIDDLRELGMDDHSPKYICPSSVSAFHSHLQHKIEEKREQERRKKEIERYLEDMKNAENMETAYAKLVGKKRFISFADGDLHAHVLSSVKEFIAEGQAMHHCVYNNGYYKEKNTLIVSVTDDSGERLATIEYNTKRKEIVQCRAKYNQVPPRKEEIERFVLSNVG